MAGTLCDTFQTLAAWTHGLLSAAGGVGHQPLEETFTDLNMLHLKLNHSADIWTKTFRKWEESQNGADWQWWITNARRSSWVGFRVQAKILNLASDRFLKLHDSNPSGLRQIDKLEQDAVVNGMTPLYCLYLRLDAKHEPLRPPAAGAKESPSLFGCSLIPLPSIWALGPESRLAKLLPFVSPWHHLVCATSSAARDLPSIAWAFAQSIGAHKVGMTHVTPSIEQGPRAQAPAYVRDIMNGDQGGEVQGDSPDADTAGIVIIAPKSGEVTRERSSF